MNEHERLVAVGMINGETGPPLDDPDQRGRNNTEHGLQVRPGSASKSGGIAAALGCVGKTAEDQIAAAVHCCGPSDELVTGRRYLPEDCALDQVAARTPGPPGDVHLTTRINRSCRDGSQNMNSLSSQMQCSHIPDT